MTQYECTECGALGRFTRVDGSAFIAECPACEEQTRWAVAFEGEGVTFE
jgi:NAD-dependent SIR2 family protein deacetylase